MVVAGSRVLLVSRQAGHPSFMVHGVLDVPGPSVDWSGGRFAHCHMNLQPQLSICWYRLMLDVPSTLTCYISLLLGTPILCPTAQAFTSFQRVPRFVEPRCDVIGEHCDPPKTCLPSRNSRELMYLARATCMQARAQLLAGASLSWDS